MRRTGFVIICFLSTLITYYVIASYGFGSKGIPVPPELQESFNRRPLAVAAHIFASATTLLLGPWQFMAGWRERWPALHRWVGRVYLGLAVPIGGLAGLYMSWYAMGGIVARLGFGCLAVVWLYSALQGFLTARARDFPGHRRWMIRNYALTFAAVTFRLFFPVTFLIEVPFEPFYRFISWMCWIPNLMVAECLIRAQRSPVGPEVVPVTQGEPVGLVRLG